MSEEPENEKEIESGHGTGRKKLGIFDPALFLVGHRGAIERIAATPMLLLVGALLVLSAGIARNYDHLDLLRQKEWFIGPFVASLVTTGFVWLWVFLGLRLYKVGSGGRQFLVFLNLVWLTAPCAWIYGIPVEQWMDLVGATKWNIAFLVIVSAWRVALMVRAVTVLTEAHWFRVLVLVLAPAALEMWLASVYKGMALVGIMGGVRLDPHEEILQTAASVTAWVSGLAFFFFITMLASLHYRLPDEAERPLTRSPRLKTGFAPFAMAGLCLGAWGAAAIPHHEPIVNRNRLEELAWSAYDGETEAAIEFALSKTREDFPQWHYLPPERGLRDLLNLLEALPEDAPTWLREEWTANAVRASKDVFWIRDWDTFVRIKESYPGIYRSMEEYAEELKADPSKDPGGGYGSWLDAWENNLRTLEAEEASEENAEE